MLCSMYSLGQNWLIRWGKLGIFDKNLFAASTDHHNRICLEEYGRISGI